MDTPRETGAPPKRLRSRWDFIRDVLLLQVKIFVIGWHTFALLPATLIAAALDLTLKSGPHGSRFYRVLEWARRSEEALHLYAALDEHYEAIDVPVGSDPAADTT